MTVAETVARYLAHAEAVTLFEPEALAERKRTLGKFVAAHGDNAVADCRAFHLSDWVEANSRWRSSSTRKSKANQVNACFNWAARCGRISTNPFASVNYPESEPRPPLVDSSLEQIELHANKAFDRAVRFLRLTGCRLSDLCRSNWADIDFERGIIVLSKHKSKKKTRKPKVIVLTDEAVEVLNEAQLASGQTEGAIFRNTRGTPWNRRTLGQQLRRMKLRHGMKFDATLHGLRHQAGTMAVRNGANPKMVSMMLGHANFAVTEKYYLHLDNDIEGIREAARAASPKKKNECHP